MGGLVNDEDEQDSLSGIEVSNNLDGFRSISLDGRGISARPENRACEESSTGSA